MEPVNFAIIGTGTIARFHAAAMAAVPSARLLAVFDTDQKRADAFAVECKTRAVSSLDQLLAMKELDAVTIATPTGAHAEVAVPAARAGKHVLCEKPLEVTLERADSIIRACRDGKVLLGGVFQGRLGKNVRRIREAIESGRLGKLALASMQMRWFRSQEYYDSGQWRGTWKLDGGGALMNQGIHSADLLRYFAGPPASVYALSGLLAHTGIEVEDTAVAAIRFANGALGTLEASTACAPGFARRIDISGSRGSVTLEDDRLVRWEFVDKQPQDDQILAEGLKGEHLQGGSKDPKAVSAEGHRLLIEDFVQAIRQHRSPIIPGPEARHAIELICGIYESARSGKPYVFPVAKV